MNTITASASRLRATLYVLIAAGNAVLAEDHWTARTVIVAAVAGSVALRSYLDTSAARVGK